MSTGRLPNFIIIGAMKSGTTTLASHLGEQPTVGISVPKEPNFFAEPGNWNRGLDWYRSLFPASSPFAGEASTFYTKEPAYTGAAERMFATVPDVRLIYIVREPLERMRSMYAHRTAKYRESSKTLADALRSDPTYISISRYDMQLRPYVDHFDPEQLIVVTTDELAEAPQTCVGRILDHIGVPSRERTPIAPVRLNSGVMNGRLTRLGYEAARIMQRIGVRDHIHSRIRSSAKRLMSTELSHHLELRPDERAMLLEQLRPDLEMTRRLVEMSGAAVPDWLAY